MRSGTIRNRIFAAAALSLFATPLYAATGLSSGDRARVTVGPGEVNSEFYVDVPEGTTHLELLLEADRPQKKDVDLFLRYAEPFDPVTDPFSQSLYHSIGETGIEHLEITFASSPPVSPGRWYVEIINAGNERTSTATLTVNLKSENEPTLKPLKLDVVYTDEDGTGFFARAPVQPEGGNEANTLGKARRQAFEEAVRILEESYSSPVPVVVEAHWSDLELPEDGDGVTLASAGPTMVFSDFPGTRIPETFYPGSTVPRLAGTDTCRLSTKVNCNEPAADVVIQFNTQVPWWYGLVPSGGGQGNDFIAVAIHEMLHGLGFLSLADVKTGELFHDIPDIYTRNLEWDDSGTLRNVAELTDDQRKRAFTAGDTSLTWAGRVGQQFWDDGGHPDCISCPRPPMYAPGTPNPGSSVSHTNFPDIMFWQATASNNNTHLDIRTPGPPLGAAWAFLRDAGWDETPKETLEGPPPPEFPRGLWYDRAREGHGFELQRIGDNWFVLLFTYDDAGNPEWYLGVGSMEGDVITTNLQRYTYEENDAGGDGNKAEPETVGSVDLALNATSNDPACDDGVDRTGASVLARFSWEIQGQSGDWCAEPLGLPGTPPNPDFSGSWYAGKSDAGWGMTIYQREKSDGTQVLVETLYYYDAEGNPRWAQGVEPDFINSHPDQAIDMRHFEGYARSSDCTPAICEPASDQSAGVIRLKLEKPLQGENPGSRATVNVEYPGSEGGTWKRNFDPIEMLSDPS